MSTKDQWVNKNKVTFLDQDYQQAALAYNTENMKKQYFLQDRAEMMACNKAFVHGMVDGGYYGGIYGLGLAIYRRQLRYIPKCALMTGFTYGVLLGSSAWFRFDI